MLRSEQHLISQVVILIHGSEVWLHQGLPAGLPEGDSSKGRSVPKIYSICSSEVEWVVRWVEGGPLVEVHLVEVQVSAFCVIPSSAHYTILVVFTASFGPGGFRTTRVRPAAAANAANAGEAQSPRSILLQLAPLLILFLFSFLTSLPSLFTTPSEPDPSYAFSFQPPYTSQRLTSTLDIPYFVSPTDFAAHPIWTSIPDSHKDLPKAGPSSRQLSQFERSIERHWTNQMVQMCEKERDGRERRIEANSGWLGVGADWEAVKRIRQENLESCEILKAKNIISRY